MTARGFTHTPAPFAHLPSDPPARTYEALRMNRELEPGALVKQARQRDRESAYRLLHDYLRSRR